MGQLLAEPRGGLEPVDARIRGHRPVGCAWLVGPRNTTVIIRVFLQSVPRAIGVLIPIISIGLPSRIIHITTRCLGVCHLNTTTLVVEQHEINSWVNILLILPPFVI
jgi:hypothetical protein